MVEVDFEIGVRSYLTAEIIRSTDRVSSLEAPKNFWTVEKIFFHTFIFLIRLLKDSFDHDLMTP